MILSLEETKLWLREDSEDPEVLQQIQMLIDAAESYLLNATGKQFSAADKQAKLFCLVLVTDWYENRDLTGSRVGEKVRFTVNSMLAQMTYCEPIAP